MDQKTFETGYDVDTYIRNIRNYRSVVRALVEEAHASDEYVEALKAKIASHGGTLRATMMSEDWCGDAACNLPILADLFGRAGVELRIFRGSEKTDLKEKYEGDGDDHIPVFSVWDADWNELGRWIEAPASMDQKKNAWKAEHPAFMELYEKQKTDREAAKLFGAMYREFLNLMVEWYKAGDWNETSREMVERIR